MSGPEGDARRWMSIWEYIVPQGERINFQKLEQKSDHIACL